MTGTTTGFNKKETDSGGPERRLREVGRRCRLRLTGRGVFMSNLAGTINSRQTFLRLLHAARKGDERR
jgi:hypothetical protein